MRNATAGCAVPWHVAERGVSVSSWHGQPLLNAASIVLGPSTVLQKEEVLRQSEPVERERDAHLNGQRCNEREWRRYWMYAQLSRSYCDGEAAVR